MANSEVYSESDEDINDTDMLAEMSKLLKTLKRMIQNWLSMKMK